MTGFFRLAPLWLALGSGLAAHADTPGDALRAADPAAPAGALPLPLPEPQRLGQSEPPADIEQARALWLEANRRVAAFPRGHIDLLRWESAQARPGAAAEPAAAPAPLTPGEALRASLRQRPDLFTHAGMNPLEQARVRMAYAAHGQTLQQAWIDAVAARDRARLRSAVHEAARTGSELGRRMVQTGNWPAARWLQEQAIESQAWQARADAELAARAALERLAGLMGVWQTDALRSLDQRLPAGLPALPERLTPGEGLTEDGIEAAALRADPLLALAREPASRHFTALPEGRWAAWSAAREAALDALPDPANAGGMQPPHIGDPLLLREAGLLEADEQRAALLARAGERRAMARLAWAQLQARHAAALHAERVLARLREAQWQETQLRYNGMFDSTWQLLASTREHLGALEAAVMARRAHWRAQAGWQALLAGAEFRLDDAVEPVAGAADDTRGGH